MTRPPTEVDVREGDAVRIPRGDLRRSRVVDDPGAVLDRALTEELTGYVVLEPQDALLLGERSAGVLTFEAGVPVLAYSAGADRGGERALADLSVPGPYRVDVYALDRAALAAAHEATPLRVPPGLPAERLAADAALAERTRAAAPDDRPEATSPLDAVETFLADEARIDAIQREARDEARRHAAEWGLDDELADDPEDGDADDPTAVDGTDSERSE